MKIENWLKAGWSPRKIADALDWHISTIYREIKRGWGQQRTSELVDYECYLADKAQNRYEAEYSGKGPDLKIGKDHAYANDLGMVLKNGYRSPEAALGDIEVLGLRFETKVSTRTLCRYIGLGIIPGASNKDLPIKGNKKPKKTEKRGKRPPRGKSIEQRPAEINCRSTFGHWEGDTAESKEGGAERIFKLTERVSRAEICLKVKSGEAKYIVRVLDRLEEQMGDMFYTVVQPITADNGVEFSDCKGMERSYRGKGKRTTIYYCHPYSSWEKGSAEKQNGMIRRQYPKGTDFAAVSVGEVSDLEDWINHYPRKQFGFRSSAESAKAHLTALGKIT